MDLPERYAIDGDAMDGGMATVFKCHDRILERPVALKVMPRRFKTRRLNDELQALYTIRSKHVVQVFDVCVDNTSVGIVQEFVDGKDLFSTDIAPSSADDFLFILWQIASGISDIHAAGLIHRDIKPNNMKVDQEGILKIFDFGLAREDGPAAATVGFVGTVGFSAPEQYVAGTQFTQSIDIFAFGATALYFGTQSLCAELSAEPPSAFASNPFLSLPFTIPTDVADTLFACMAHLPSNRPKMSAVCQTIEKHLLFNRHRALVVLNGKPSYLDKDNTSVSLTFGSIAGVKIEYDGLLFKVTNVAGDVFVNNAAVAVGDALPGACVLTLGGPERRATQRAYVTFDLSNPEIIA
ncbi:serine/threonine-protein kinase [uncultured Roseovarius sp.]|uniref:serine/threonine-protein kinase n=1 Tax=uncultured Roseovarius sp. TaxID=293344 RepID=UPI00260EA92E|nr:serine/threonine-protein kinase [uncultured Roseovarius sp.]